MESVNSKTISLVDGVCGPLTAAKLSEYRGIPNAFYSYRT